MLRAQGNRMLQILMSSWQPGSLNTYGLWCEWVKKRRRRKLQSTASGMADTIFSPYLAKSTELSFAWYQKLRRAKENPLQPCKSLRLLSIIPGLRVSHSQSPRHVPILFLPPANGSPTPPPTQWPCYLTINSKVAIKKCWRLCTNSTLQTLHDLIWNICFYIICRF